MHSFPEAAVWRTSTYTQNENCVEVADLPGVSAVRDTKSRELGALVFPAAEWHALIEAAKRGVL